MTSTIRDAPKNKDTLSAAAWFAVALAALPFVAKRAVLLGSHDYPFRLATDYGARALSLLGVAMAQRCGVFAAPKSHAGPLSSVLTLFALLAAQLSLRACVYPVLLLHLNYLQLSSFPTIQNPFVQDLDLTFGLFLVALSEESVFRALLFSVFERWRMSALAIIVASSGGFALIHLTSGIADTVDAFLQGLLLGTAYWKTRRLSICIAAHYLFDLYVFGYA